MPENPAAEPAAQTNAQIAQPAQNGNGDSQTQTLTADAIKNMIEEANRPLHAEIRRLREGVQPRQKQQDAAERTITQRVQDIEAREARLAERSRIEAIRDAADRAGVSHDRLDIFTDHVLAQHGKSVVIRNDEVGWVDLDDDNPRPLSDLIDKMLKSRSEVFKPSAPLPSARGLRANGRVTATVRNYDDVPFEARMKMSPAERLKLAQDSIGQE